MLGRIRRFGTKLGVIQSVLGVLLGAGPALAQVQPAPVATAAPVPAPAAPAPSPPVAPAAPAPPIAPAPAPPNPNLCMPSCRTGYICMQQQCVSACNPVCAAGETCTARGECERPPAYASAVTPSGAAAGAPPEPGDPGWATGGGVFGVIAAAGTVGLAVASEVTKDEQIPSLPLGIGATALIAIAGPITAVGGASARDRGGVRGSPGLRVAGWLGYALTLLDASALIGLGVAEITPPDGLITSVGLLGASSLTCLAADAFMSASEANESARPSALPASSPSVSPLFSLRRARDESLVPSIGVAGAF